MMYFRYLKYVIIHKWYVFLECCKLGIPFLGMIHDWSKFLPSEFIPYARYFCSGIDRGRDKTGYYKPYNTGDKEFDTAWFYHSRRNKHHWQLWVYPNDGDDEICITVKIMPLKYRKEMLADWRGAGRAQKTTGTTKQWYEKNRDKLVLHPETRKWIEENL